MSCNSGFGCGNSWWWIIILVIILFLVCGCGSCGNNSCGCDNTCGCC